MLTEEQSEALRNRMLLKAFLPAQKSKAEADKEMAEMEARKGIVIDAPENETKGYDQYLRKAAETGQLSPDYYYLYRGSTDKKTVPLIEKSLGFVE